MGAFRRFTNLFRRTAVNHEIEAELQAHIDLATERGMREGLPPEAARREALLRFGNPASTRERVLSADAALSFESVWADIRFAARQLLRSPGFAITSILTLSIGIGANTAIFSSMDAVVLHPLAVPRLDRVVTVAEQQISGDFQIASLANYEDWARQSHSFEQLAVRTGKDMSLTGAGDAEHVQTTLTSANFFSVLEVQPLIGRVYGESESLPGRDSVAVLNYGFWQRRFGGDPAVLGRKVVLDQREYTVVGVMPKTMQYPSDADFYLPFAPMQKELQNRTDRSYFVTGRLRDGVTIKQAQAEMRIVAQRLAQAYPSTNRDMSIAVEPLLDGVNGTYTPLYYRLLLGATLFVLLVVCANVANLQFARGLQRRPEIAMRTALGASRTRILRQLLTESALLGLLGAAGGLLVGGLYLHLILIAMPARIARFMAGWSNISLNGRVLAFSLLIAAGAGIVSGIAPAIEALRINLANQIKAGSRGTTGSGRSHRLRNIFAVAQVALAVALVVGAALMSKGMWSMLHLADSYRPEKILTFNVTLPPAHYDTVQKQVAWYADSLEKLRALPGVTHAEISISLPNSDRGWLHDLEIENRKTVPGKYQSTLRIPVSDGYFLAFQIPIVAGRSFNRGDSLETTPVAVVSQKFVAQYFPGENPIGHRIRTGGLNTTEPWATIVGVARETSYSTWDDTPQPAVYFDAAQVPPMDTTYAVMTNGNPLALAPSVRKALVSVDPNLPLDMVLTYRQYLNEQMTGLIYAAVMLVIDALIALLLAAIGIFGVMANLVGEQTREIGVRLAMGARREDVLRMILRRAGWLTAAGLGSGLVLAFGLSHLVANLLRGVRSDDPVIFSAIAVAITAVSIASSWIPARRASHVDPMQALRSE
ncbi:MAG TPA: ABC transporter permease [Terracidiphilus sp.]|jgi:putative ABC transport system permease protein|nr:ABC transporter permease [Terracidiphilus sp.]